MQKTHIFIMKFWRRKQRKMTFFFKYLFKGFLIFFLFLTWNIWWSPLLYDPLAEREENLISHHMSKTEFLFNPYPPAGRRTRRLNIRLAYSVLHSAGSEAYIYLNAISASRTHTAHAPTRFFWTTSKSFLVLTLISAEFISTGHYITNRPLS